MQHSWFISQPQIWSNSVSFGPLLHAASLFQRKSGSLYSANLRDFYGLQLDINPFSLCYWTAVSGDQPLPCHSLLLWSALRMYKEGFTACSSSEDDLLWIPVLDRGQQTTVPSSAHHKCGLKLKVQASVITDRHDEAHIRGPLTASSLNRITNDLMKVIMIFHRTEHSMNLDCYARDYCQSVYYQIQKKITHKRKN